MDGARFQAIIRGFAGGRASRRSVARGVAGLGFGAALLRFPGVEDAEAACAAVGKRCSKKTRCCAGARCAKRRCACEAGLTRCGARCVDRQRDAQNCGGCGLACRQGTICGDGICVATFGGSGEGLREFRLPTGIAAAGRTMAVADSGNDRVQVLDLDGPDTTVLLGSQEAGGRLNFPTGVAIASDGAIFVADTVNNRIQKFDAAGLPLLAFGTLGSGPGQFSAPHGLAIDRNGNLFVADLGNDRIQRFNRNGFFLGQFGRRGDGTGDLFSPEAVAVDDEQGLVFVADTGNDRIQVFDKDGAFVRTIGLEGSGNGEFKEPQGVAFDGGTLLVADTGNQRIQALDRQGRFLDAFAVSAPAGRPAKFMALRGIAVDGSGAIRVVEHLADRITSLSRPARR